MTLKVDLAPHTCGHVHSQGNTHARTHARFNMLIKWMTMAFLKCHRRPSPWVWQKCPEAGSGSSAFRLVSRPKGKDLLILCPPAERTAVLYLWIRKGLLKQRPPFRETASTDQTEEQGYC